MLSYSCIPGFMPDSHKKTWMASNGDNFILIKKCPALTQRLNALNQEDRSERVVKNILCHYHRVWNTLFQEQNQNVWSFLIDALNIGSPYSYNSIKRMVR